MHHPETTGTGNAAPWIDMATKLNEEAAKLGEGGTTEQATTESATSAIDHTTEPANDTVAEQAAEIATGAGIEAALADVSDDESADDNSSSPENSSPDSSDGSAGPENSETAEEVTTTRQELPPILDVEESAQSAEEDRQAEIRQTFEHIPDKEVLDATISDLIRRQIEHASERGTQKYAEERHTLGVLQEAERYLAIHEAAETVKADTATPESDAATAPSADKPIMQKILQRIADGYLGQGEFYFKESEKYANLGEQDSAKLAEVCEQQGTESMWRGQIAAELAHGGYDDLKYAFGQKYNELRHPETPIGPNSLPGDVISDTPGKPSDEEAA